MEEETQAQQGELFEEFSQRAKGISRFSWLKKSLSFRPLVFVISYEKLIFLTISLLIILTVIFCVGVEQGKRVAENTKAKIITAASVALPPAVLNSTPPSNITKKEVLPSEEKKVVPSHNLKFVVQVASLRDRSSAETEVAELKSKKYSAYWVASGEYYVVYVGPFVDKKQVNTALVKLKKVYRTAYIKKR